jgi:peroxiredoxin Q/BCP
MHKTTKKKAKTSAKRPAKARAPERVAREPKKPATKHASGGADRFVGKPAPRFELSDHSGAIVSSAALAGASYVVYFYPKDDTPGCTKEACDFRDGIGAFAKARVRVVGVSPDSTASHERFAGKYELPFQLLSDPDKKLAKAYGVWVKKQNYGREYMGIERSTFLIDAKGVVRRAWRKVKVSGHVAEVISAARELG